MDYVLPVLDYGDILYMHASAVTLKPFITHFFKLISLFILHFLSEFLFLSLAALVSFVLLLIIDYM